MNEYHVSNVRQKLNHLELSASERCKDNDNDDDKDNNVNDHNDNNADNDDNNDDVDCNMKNAKNNDNDKDTKNNTNNNQSLPRSTWSKRRTDKWNSKQPTKPNQQ